MHLLSGGGGCETKLKRESVLLLVVISHYHVCFNLYLYLCRALNFNHELKDVTRNKDNGDRDKQIVDQVQYRSFDTITFYNPTRRVNEKEEDMFDLK